MVHVASKKLFGQTLISRLITSHNKYCFKVIPQLVHIYYVSMIILKSRCKIFSKHAFLKWKCQTWGDETVE